MPLRFVRPNAELKEKALDFKKEFFDHGERIINGSERLDQMNVYEDWLCAVTNNTSEDSKDPHWVVTDTFFALDSCDQIVGIIDFRHTLNDFLKDLGNCGYSVRPTERKKGYASEMLKQLIDYAKDLGFHELHISVECNNQPSIRTIVKNGGVYERSFTFENEQADIYRLEF